MAARVAFVDTVEELAASRPDVAVFRDPVLEPGALTGFDGIALAVATRADVRADASNFDRIVATDPRLAESLAAWRTIPFPVADERFADVAPIHGQPRIVLDGEPTPTRRRFLESLGEEFGSMPWSADGDIVIHLHDAGDEGAAERISWHLAAGRLIIADRQRPRHDLVPGVHYVEAGAGWHLGQLVYDLRRWPDNHDVVRMRGRRRAERSRQSQLYPRLIADLYRDLAAFGSERPKTSTSSTMSRTSAG
jgi:hypothetical protein